MKQLSKEEKAAIQALTDAYAASLKVHPTKGKYEFKKQADFSSVNFSAAEDLGNPEMTDFSIYDDCSTFAAFSAKAKAETSINKIKSLVLNHDVAESVKQYCLKKNEITRRNRNRKAEQQKAFSNR